MNIINYLLKHGKRRPTGAGDVLTHVKVHKGVGSLDVAIGVDSDGTESALSCGGVINFLGSFHVRNKLDSTILVEVQTTASDGAFGADGAGHPRFSGNIVIQKDANED